MAEIVIHGVKKVLKSEHKMSGFMVTDIIILTNEGKLVISLFYDGDRPLAINEVSFEETCNVT